MHIHDLDPHKEFTFNKSGMHITLIILLYQIAIHDGTERHVLEPDGDGSKLGRKPA
jgi:hypothetical protein